MGLFNIWKKKAEEQKPHIDVASAVRNMLDKNGYSYENDGNMFALSLSGKHADFKTGLTCEANKLVVYAIAPMPVPEHVHIPISFEINRINKENPDITIILNDHSDTATLGAISEKTFSSEPTAEELQITILHPMDVLDSYFSSLMCAIFGVTTDEELKQRMLSSSAAEDTKDNSVIFQVKDPYHDALDQSEGISSPRFGGRLLALAIHIIENRISKTFANKLLTNQTEYTDIIQTAYNVGNAEERNLIRKLAFLINEKRTTTDNQAEEFVGRMEGMSMAANDNLLKNNT